MKPTTRFNLLALALVALLATTGCQDEEMGNLETFPDDTETVAATDAPAPEIVAGTYAIDGSHSELGFSVKHLGLANVRGRFDDADGSVTFADNDLSSMTARAVIQTTSINTRNDRRDNHLRSDDFFNAETYPEIVFESTSVTPLGGGRFRMNGNLTIRDNTRPVTLEGEYFGTQMMGEQRKVALSAEGEINRQDFGLAWNRLTEGVQVVGDTVTLVLDVEADLVDAAETD